MALYLFIHFQKSWIHSCNYLFSLIAANLQFLSVGPDLVAICGTQAKRYLAVDETGRLFTTVNEQ